MITLHNYTTINKYLETMEDNNIYGDTSPKQLGTIAPGDSLPEWAARLCYKSNDKFGSNPAFISGIVKVGHFDVLEHFSVSFIINVAADLSTYKVLFNLRNLYPYLYIEDFYINKVSGKQRLTAVFTANLRVWYEIVIRDRSEKIFPLFANGELSDILVIENTLYKLAPNIFTEVEDRWKEAQNISPFLSMIDSSINYIEKNSVSIEPVLTDTGALVTILGITPYRTFNDDFHVCFQIDHVSRSCLNQHVRHRLLSHSAESQRYVDISKSGTNYIVPPDFDEDQKDALDNTIDVLAGQYRTWRESGVKKEDARCILPNCLASRIVSSGNYKGVMHYIELRSAKDAQYEIRQIAIALAKSIEQVIKRSEVKPEEI